MTAHECAQPVGSAVGLREHRPLLEVALYVLGERRDRRVAFHGQPLQGLEHDGVEIATQRTPPRLRRLRAGPAGGQPIDGQGHGLGHGRRCRTVQPVRPHVGEQFVEHDTERVDIARRADRLAEDLLRAGVLRREGAAGFAGEFGLDGRAGVQQLGDAEVQQAHLARGGDEDVGRLQVAVHDEVGVCMRDGAGDLQEEPEPLSHRQITRAAVGVDPLAPDILQRQPGLAFGRDAGVVQARDVRVLQRREDLAFARHALGQARALPCTMRQFQRDLPTLQHVGAFGQPHAAHATAAQFADQPVGAEDIAWLLGVGRSRAGLWRELARLDLGQGLQQAGRGVGGLAFGAGCQQQRLEPRLQARRARLGQATQPGRAFGRRQRQSLVEQRAQHRPLVRRELEDLVHRTFPSDRARACRRWPPPGAGPRSSGPPGPVNTGAHLVARIFAPGTVMHPRLMMAIPSQEGWPRSTSARCGERAGPADPDTAHRA